MEQAAVCRCRSVSDRPIGKLRAMRVRLVLTEKPVLREGLMDYHRPMASDNRDWYRDWWRKKTGYVERAGFRISEADRQRAKHASEWRAIFVKLALFVLAVVVFVVVKRTMLLQSAHLV